MRMVSCKILLVHIAFGTHFSTTRICPIDTCLCTLVPLSRPKGCLRIAVRERMYSCMAICTQFRSELSVYFWLTCFVALRYIWEESLNGRVGLSWLDSAHWTSRQVHCVYIVLQVLSHHGRLAQLVRAWC